MKTCFFIGHRDAPEKIKLIFAATLMQKNNSTTRSTKKSREIFATFFVKMLANACGERYNFREVMV